MWLILALLTALFTSFQDVIGKKILKEGNAYVVAFSWMFFSLPILVPVAWMQGAIDVNPSFFKALVVSSVLVSLASIFYFKAIQSADLSLAMPLLAFTPALLLITSPLILGEFPSMIGLVGILLIVSGSYVINFKIKERNFLLPFKRLVSEKGPRFMLAVAFLFSVAANFDKVGVMSTSPIFWIACLNVSLSLILFIVMVRRVENIRYQFKKYGSLLVLIGLLNAITMIFQMTAIRLTIVPYLISVKRTSVIISSLFGFFLFGERNIVLRLIGTILMLIGVFLIAFS